MTGLHRLLLAGLLVLLLGSGLAAVWVHRFPPLQDYPVWLYEASVLSGEIPFGAGSQAVLTVPIPNAANTAVIGWTASRMGIETAGKCFLTATLLAMTLGVYMILSAFRSGPASWPAVLLVPGFFFFQGNLNYVLGLGILFIGIAYLVARSSRSSRASAIVLGVVTVCVFLCHAAVLACWGAFLLGFLLRGGAKNRRRILVGQIPGVLLGVWSALSWRVPLRMVEEKQESLGLALWAKSKIVTAIQAGAPFSAFDAPPDTVDGFSWILGANILSVAVIASAAVIGGRRLLTSRADLNWIRVPLAACLFVFLALPPFLFGVHNPGQRFLPPLLVVAMAGAPIRTLSRPLGVLTGLAAAAFVVYSLITVGGAGEALEQTYTVMQSVDSRGNGDLVDVSLFDYANTGMAPARASGVVRIFVPRQKVLARVLYYLKIRSGEPASIWGTGLVQKSSDQFPFVVSAKEVLDRKVSGQIWIVGPADQRRKIAASLVSKYRVAAKADPVTLIVPLE